MKKTSPKVWFLADPDNTGELEQFLVTNQVKWRPDPGVSFLENLMEFGGRLCYWSFEDEGGGYANQNLTKTTEGNKKYLGNVLNQGHGSIFEHGNLVFLFENVSRVFTHELVRHRAGSAFSQTSGRYVRLDEIPFWKPEVIAENTEASKVFDRVISEIEIAQKELNAIYDIDNLPMKEKKQLTSAFRRIAPIGISNNILFSTNHRALRHIIKMRTDASAEVEIRMMFDYIAEMVKHKFPNIYQDMEQQEDGSWKFTNDKV